MDAMDDRYNYASPLTGHQDPVPNSDAARLRLDSPSWHLGASRVYIQWVKKLSQCLAVLERLTWHKSNKLRNNLKIIYVILGHLSFHISLNSRDLK
jgi:hypothetical protein